VTRFPCHPSRSPRAPIPTTAAAATSNAVEITSAARPHSACRHPNAVPGWPVGFQPDSHHCPCCARAPSASVAACRRRFGRTASGAGPASLRKREKIGSASQAQAITLVPGELVNAKLIRRRPAPECFPKRPPASGVESLVATHERDKLPARAGASMPALPTSLAARRKFRERTVVDLILGGVAFPDGGLGSNGARWVPSHQKCREPGV
jgi:hypothetical protein